MISFLEEAASVRPTEQQMNWYEMGGYAFAHFGVNTFTDREWGLGNEDERLFAPKALDCDQWVEVIKSAGLKGLILTAKHHDGFCLWNTATTEHCVRNASVKTDVVAEAAAACARGGIRFGFYLSPWDRNSRFYGTDAYNDFFCEQLTELLTGYGPIFCVWFDNACGEGPDGRKQVYDFPRYFELIRKYQPDAVIFNDYGPDIRWCGNEAGKARDAEWAVVPSELCHWSPVQTGPGPLSEHADLSYMYNTCSRIGSMENILYSRGLTFTPSEIDVSIRPGWFWHPQEKPKSVEELFRIYLNSVGGNCCLNLNLPPNREGRIDDEDAERLKEFRAFLDENLGTPVPAEISELPGHSSTQPCFRIRFDRPRDDIRYLVLRENIAVGQRIESFVVLGTFPDARYTPFSQGTTVGNRRIVVLRDPFEGQNPLTRKFSGGISELLLQVTAARGPVDMKSIEVY